MSQENLQPSELHDSLYRKAIEILKPFVLEASRGVHTDAVERSTEEKLSAVCRGCELLERAVSINPQNWNALWVMGAAWRAVDRWDDAYRAFKRAFDVNRNNINVARDLAGVCARVGRPAEAVKMARHALSLSPEDPSLMANLGYVLLSYGDIAGAAREVSRALLLDPLDPITLDLWAAVKERQARGS